MKPVREKLALFGFSVLVAITDFFCMYIVLNEVYLQNLFMNGATFRDESNDSN